MDFQFALGNPSNLKGRRKRVARSKKRRTLKASGPRTRHLRIVKISKSQGGLSMARRKKRRHHKAARHHKRPTHRRRHHAKRRKNPYITWTKKRPGQKTLKHRVHVMSKGESSKLLEKIKKLQTLQKTKPTKGGARRLKQLKRKFSGDIDKLERFTGGQEAKAFREEGYTESFDPDRKKKRKSKRKKTSKKKASKAQGRKHMARRKKHSKRKGGAKKTRKHKRHYAKQYTHRHSRKTKHVKAGQTLSGKIYSKGRGRRRLKATVRIKFNPLPGGKMVRDYTGYDWQGVGALGLGGLLYGALNGLWNKYAPGPAQTINTLPVVGPTLGPVAFPLILGAAIHKFLGNKHAAFRMLGEGLAGASIAALGANLSQQVPFLKAQMSGINYTPNMRGINYTPNINGVDFTPDVRMGIMPQLGESPDFGAAADYGGGAGMTTAHPFSPSDFGSEEYEPGNTMA